MPEKSVNEVSRSLREQYEKGLLAFEKNNLDYAVALLSQVVAEEPAFFECRQVLRVSQFKRAGGSNKTGLFRRLLGSTNPKLVQARMALRANPVEALNLAESVLNGDPNNLDAHKVLAEAALALGFPFTAVLSLEIVFKQLPKDRDVAAKLAAAFTQAGQPGRAEKVLSDILRAYPHDADLAQLYKNVAANRTMSESGYGRLESGQGSYRDILRDEQQAVQLEKSGRELRFGDEAAQGIALLEARLRQHPGDVQIIRSLAELHVQREEYDRALELYRPLLAGENPDPSLEKVVADLELRKLDRQIARLDSAAPDYAERQRQVVAQKADLALAQARQQVERYPNDLAFRFELGQRLLEAGKVGEAIAEFQKAQNNPHKRIAAMHHLGRCFVQRGMADLAIRTFQNALKEKPVFDDEKKELIYDLGLALAKSGKQEEAMDQFKLIYETDIGYRDIAARVDAYYAAKAQGT